MMLYKNIRKVIFVVLGLSVLLNHCLKCQINQIKEYRISLVRLYTLDMKICFIGQLLLRTRTGVIFIGARLVATQQISAKQAARSVKM